MEITDKLINKVMKEFDYDTLCEYCSNFVHKYYKYFCLLCLCEICNTCCSITSKLGNENDNCGICIKCNDIYENSKKYYEQCFKKCISQYISSDISNIIMLYI